VPDEAAPMKDTWFCVVFYHAITETRHPAHGRVSRKYQLNDRVFTQRASFA